MLEGNLNGARLLEINCETGFLTFNLRTCQLSFDDDLASDLANVLDLLELFV